MPGRLKVLSGAEVVRVFEGLGFQVVRQSGSHVKLRRVGPSGRQETLHVPLHAQLKRGTLRAIVRQASEFVSIDELRPHFFGD